MIKIFPIDFIRQALEQTLLEEHIKNVHYFGGKDQVNIFSFYEQLKGQDEVDRFVKNYRDLTDQQNRSGLIGNGVLLAPENPSITNLYTNTIIPMSWNCSIRCKLGNRDQMIETLNNLTDNLKGRKIDIAQLKCNDENGKDYYVPFKVGTIGQMLGEPFVKNGDFIGSLSSANDVINVLNGLEQKYIQRMFNLNWLYAENEGVLKVAMKDYIYVESLEEYDEPTIVGTQDFYVDATLDGVYSDEEIGTITANLSIYGDETVILQLEGNIESSNVANEKTVLSLHFRTEEPIANYVDNYIDFALEDISVLAREEQWVFVVDDGTHEDIVFPPEHESFEKFKLSLSFDAIRCDEPRNLNADEYCELSFSGSATLVSSGVVLGNDLIKIAISKIKVDGSSVFNYNANAYYLEPLEMPSGNNLSNQVNQLLSAKFLTKPHTDSLTPTIQYTFICDLSNPLLVAWFGYARYGHWSLVETSVDNQISPNTEYAIFELWSSWADVRTIYYGGKIVENIDIENTESDVLTLSVSFQVIGND